jgi:hypothetical protein
MIEITAIRLAGGTSHEHITDVLWRSATTSTGLCPQEAIVDWLSVSTDNQAVVADGSNWVPVLVVRPGNRRPYIRAQSDGVWTDDLLTLPAF